MDSLALSAAPVKVEHKIVAAFTVAFLAIILVGAATFYDARMLLEHNRWVVHTYRVLSQINEVFSSIDEIESGGRGYLLTGKKDYLQPYQAGIDAVGSQLDELAKLTADNPHQQRNIEQTRTLVNRAIAYLHEKIELRQTRSLEAIAPTLGTESKENMDQVRFATAAMKSVENRLLEERESEFTQSIHRTQTSFGLLLALAVVLLAGFFVFIWHDLADRRRADEALRQSDLKFRGLMASAPDAMIIADDEGVVQMVNARAEELFGYSREEFIGRDLAGMLMQRDVAHAESDEETARQPGSRDQDPALKEFQTLAAKFDGVRKNGDLFPLDLSRSPVEVGGERLVITSLRDRTTQQAAEDALSRYSLELSRSNAELERFAYVASHDLQEPLRMVSSYTQLLSRRYKGKLDASADEFIAYAVDGANRMQKLINDLLALSRVGTQAKPSEPVDTGAVLAQVLSDMKPTVEAAGADISFPDHMPTVSADGTQIGQLFQNLVGNALKFRGAEPPRVEIKVEETDDEFWKFSFKDNGIGIEPQYFERIFVIFQRLHGKEQYPGTGIGLAICKKIVERHGGRLWLESQPGHGANFLFTLPASS